MPLAALWGNPGDFLDPDADTFIGVGSCGVRGVEERRDVRLESGLSAVGFNELVAERERSRSGSILTGGGGLGVERSTKDLEPLLGRGAS